MQFNLITLAIAASTCSAIILSSCAPQNKRKALAHKMDQRFNYADKNQDGRLDLYEFQNRESKRPSSPNRPQHNQAQVFQKIDQNGDGYLTRDEMKRTTRKKLRKGYMERRGYPDRRQAQ